MPMGGIKKSEDKLCRVCGDKALGYNFSVITCESCKAFFRRNAVKDKQLKCPFQNECKIDVVTRRFCQKCRLDKCITVGMKKEWIMSEEEKKIKNAKINGNKIKKKLGKGWKVPASAPYPTNLQPEMIQSTSSSNPVQFVQDANPKPQARVNAMPQQPVSIPTTEPCHMPSPLSPINQSATPILVTEAGTYADISWQNSSSSQPLPSVDSLIVKANLHQPSNNFPENYSTYVPENNYVPVCSDVEIKSCENKCSDANNSITARTWPHNTVKEVLDIAISAEYSDLANETGLQYFGSNELTTIEAQKIHELICANTTLQPTDDDHVFFEKGGPTPCLIDIINMTDNAIRKLIKMSKKITAFKNLCQEDQIALLKGSCTELMILRSAISYDSEKDGWEVPEVTCIKMDGLKEAKGNIYEEHKRFVQSFDSTWRNDETIMLILTTIVLFTPTRPNILHPQVIEKEQYSYYFLLQRYLESKNSCCDAQVQFIKLIQTVQELKKLNENHIRIILDVNPKDVEPLLIEIFDLSR